MIHNKKSKYVLLSSSILLASMILTVTSIFSVYASSDAYNSGYDHGCDDAVISDPDDRYINQPDTGPSSHTGRFMDGYNDGFDACSGNNRGSNGGSEQDGQDNDGGLKIFLTVESDLNDDVRINTYQFGDSVYTHDGFVNAGRNEITLEYPSRLIDTGEFRICVSALNFDESACDNAYNTEAKQPEHVFINLFSNGGDGVDQGQAQDQSQSQSQSQDQTVIVCPANARCIIEQ